MPYYEALDAFTELKPFCIVQLEPDLFNILMVADQNYFDEIKTEAAARLRRLCGDRPEYRLRLVEEIPKDPSGKLRMLVSNVIRGSNGMQPLFRASLKGCSGSCVKAPIR